MGKKKGTKSGVQKSKPSGFEFLLEKKGNKSDFWPVYADFSAFPHKKLK